MATVTMRAVEKRKSLLLFLFSRRGGLGGLRFYHALLELVHATGGVHKLLLAGIKGMAGITNTNNDHWLCGPGLDHVAARATDLGLHIFWMNICFHKGRTE